MFKRIWTTLLVICLLAGTVALLRFINRSKSLPDLSGREEIDVIPNKSLTQLTGDGVTPVLENDDFILSIDFSTGNIELYHKAAGYTWTSRPSEADMAKEGGNDLWKGNITSPVMFTYVNNLTSMDTKMGNVYNQDTAITVYGLKDGVRVFFDFRATGITFGYDISLTEDGFVLDIPQYLVSDGGEQFMEDQNGRLIVDTSRTACLTDFAVFPFLGAARSDGGEEGYLFLPDGPGALVRFENNRAVNTQFIGQVYGRDYAYMTDFDNTFFQQYDKPVVNFPVFGILRNEHSLMAVIDEGESLTDIIGNPAYVQTGFNNVYARFSYRGKFRMLTNSQTSDGYSRFTDFTLSEKRTIRYYFDSGQNAGYVGMALAYREHLVEKYDLHKLRQSEEDMPFRLYIQCGDMKDAVLGSSFIKMTSFDQAREILQYFHEAGITSLSPVVSGWQKRGNSVNNPDKFPAAGQLGGDSSLKQLIEYAHELGYPIILTDNNASVYNSTKGIRLSRDTVYNVQGFSVFGGWQLTASASRELFLKNLSRFRQYGADGLEAEGFARYLLTDFNKNSPMSRTEVMNAQRETSRIMIDSMDEMYFNSPRSYLLQDGVVFAFMPLDGTYLTVLDESVPFYNIALHGYIPYYGEIYNWLNEPDKDLLEALTYGAMPSFELTYSPSEEVLGAEQTWVFSSHFEKRRDEFIGVYNRYKDVYKLIYDKCIEEYVEISRELTYVRYEDVELYVNYGGQDISYSGVTVPARGFVALRGEDVLMISMAPADVSLDNESLSSTGRM